MDKPNIAPLVSIGTEEQGSIVSSNASGNIFVTEKAGYRKVQTQDILATFHTLWFSAENSPESEVRVGVIRQFRGVWIAVSLVGAHKEERFTSLDKAESWLIERHQKNQRSYQAHIKLMAAPSW
jgi:hypothetical protein